MTPAPKKFRILSLDGGARAPLMIRLLKRLHEMVPNFLDSVDIFAGNSAGSMTAAVILSRPNFEEGLAAAEQFWAESSNPKIELVDQLFALTGRFPLMQNREIRARLKSFLGDSRMCDLQKKVVIPAFSLDNGAPDPRYRSWSPRLFHNFSPDMPEAQDLVRDVVMRSSSAPIISPVFQGHIDGAIFANNPSLCAISLVIDAYDAALENIEVLSIGMGQNPIYLSTPSPNLGYADWLLNPKHPMALLNAVAESNLKATNYQCGRLLKEAFYRLDPRLPSAFHLNSTDRQRFKNELESIETGPDLTGAAAWLKQHKWHKIAPAAVINAEEPPKVTKRKKQVAATSSAPKPRKRSIPRPSKSPSK